MKIKHYPIKFNLKCNNGYIVPNINDMFIHYFSWNGEGNKYSLTSMNFELLNNSDNS